jgi:hypothetical protein
VKKIGLKLLVTFAYFVMVLVNYLANTLPLNNRSTGQISDAYQNLFAPAGITFSIWGLIYLLLALYLIYQWILLKRDLAVINWLFLGTSLANIAWVFAWHFDFIGLSVIFMLALLILLIRIIDVMPKLNYKEYYFIKIPFSIYFGWITVATIANITVFLVSLNWDGFGIADYIWTSIVLLIGTFIGAWRMLKDSSLEYGLVFVWAYLGILLKHLSPAGFNKEYPLVIGTLILCLIFFGYFLLTLWSRK